MAKRFTDTEIWNDDWFYELSPEYKLFWFYIKDDCNHAGIWKPKTRSFAALSDVEINLENALEYFNMGKNRIRVLNSGHWLIEDFFLFQYAERTKLINLNNRVHKSVFDTYMSMCVPLSTIRGIDRVIPVGSKECVAVLEYESIWGTV